MSKDYMELGTGIALIKSLSGVNKVEGAVEAAQAAQTAAETAKTAAQTAQAGAEAAEAAAEAVQESIPEDYSELSDDVSALKSHIGQIENLEDRTFQWESGTAYNNTGTGRISISASDIRCRHIPTQLDPSLVKIKARSGYVYYCMACTFDGTYYHQAHAFHDSFVSVDTDVSEYSADYYIIVVCAKSDNSEITPSEALAGAVYSTHFASAIDELKSQVESNTVTINDVKDVTDVVADVIMRQNITPSDIQAGKCYYQATNSLVGVNDGSVEKVLYNAGTDYYVTTKFLGASTGFPLISYFDSNDSLLSYDYMNPAGVEISIDAQKLHVPTGTSWFYINGRNTTIEVFTYQKPSVNYAELVDEIGAKEISVLFVGNSLTQDGIAYLPYMLRTFYPDIDFHLYMWYNGGKTLAQQYEYFENDTACEVFSVAENAASWTNYSNSVKMSSILTTYKFDVVCMQEYFNYKSSYTASDLDDWNDCMNYIAGNYTGGNGLEFITLFHAPLRSDATNVFNLTKTGCGLILQDTVAQDMIPNGIAIYRALSTDLDDLGDQGHLSPDGTHTQEGLPCLLQTYVTLCWLFDKMSINKSVYGLPFKMTTAIYNTLNVPGPNLGTGVIEGTDAQNLLAQDVAIKAYKEGKSFVSKHIFVES